MRLTIFINFVFSSVLFVHVAKALHELDEFPVSFQLCVKEQNNPHTRYIKLGYDNIWSFYKGTTGFEGVWVGWAGHENHSTMSSVKGMIYNIFPSL